MSEKQDAMMRRIFKHVNTFMVLMWRLGLGRMINIWPEGSGRIMVIVHTGRKTGQTRYAPVNYAIVDGELYCTAGYGPQTQWYQNIMAIPEVEVWLPNGRWLGVVTDMTDHPNRLRIEREIMIASGFAAPLLADIHPRTMSDEELREAISAHRLLHIQRGPKRHTPGDLAWMWWLLVGLIMVRRHKR